MIRQGGYVGTAKDELATEQHESPVDELVNDAMGQRRSSPYTGRTVPWTRPPKTWQIAMAQQLADRMGFAGMEPIMILVRAMRVSHSL
jgi:hypothetical protein